MISRRWRGNLLKALIYSVSYSRKDKREKVRIGRKGRTREAETGCLGLNGRAGGCLDGNREKKK